MGLFAKRRVSNVIGGLVVGRWRYLRIIRVRVIHDTSRRNNRLNQDGLTRQFLKVALATNFLAALGDGFHFGGMMVDVDCEWKGKRRKTSLQYEIAGATTQILFVAPPVATSYGTVL